MKVEIVPCDCDWVKFELFHWIFSSGEVIHLIVWKANTSICAAPIKLQSRNVQMKTFYHTSSENAEILSHQAMRCYAVRTLWRFQFRIHVRWRHSSMTIKHQIRVLSNTVHVWLCSTNVLSLSRLPDIATYCSGRPLYFKIYFQGISKQHK